MDWKEFKAANVDDALMEASLGLGVPSTELVYEVVEEGSSGFLGIGKKPAVIKARVKTESDALLEEASKNVDKKLEDKKETKKEEKPKFTMEVKEDQVKVDTFNNNKTTVNKKAEAKKEKPVKHKEAVSKEEAVENHKKERVIVNPSNLEEVLKKTKEFLGELFSAMDMDTQVEVSFDEKKNDINIELSGENMGVLIGKRGNTLDSLQYLTSLYCNKISDEYVRVKMDTENYRARRKQTLEHLAKNIAYKVKKTRRPVYLEPMNPYERRIIHSALQNDHYVTTKSEGEEPYRKVVILLKK